MFSPLLVKFIRDTQSNAIREKNFVPDPERYVRASAMLWAEILERNSAASGPELGDLQDTATLMRILGPLQNPMHLFALVRYNREVLEVSRRMGLADDSWVPFASATFGSVQAVTRLIRQEYIIIYNDGLFSLADLISSLLSYAITDFNLGGDARESYGESAQRAFRSDSEIIQALVTMVVSYVSTGDPREAAKTVPAELLVSDAVHCLLRDTALRFVVAHELGHVYLKHLETPRFEATMAPRGVVSHDWQLEYDADAFAAKTAIRAIADARGRTAPSNPYFELLAVEIQPMLLVLISSAHDYLEHGAIPQREVGRGTHPPTDLRFANVRASIAAAWADSPVTDKELLDEVNGFMDFIVWALLPPLRERCLALRRIGVRPV